jgi:tetratricopeptide (TPR) repeat protein
MVARVRIPRWRRLGVTLGALGALAASAAAPGVTRVAHADDTDAKLDAYENEARQLATNLPHPNQISGPAGKRRLVDAQVAYGLGDYSGASLALFELASKPGPDRETASFYLAESLFQKGDRGAARTYYEQVVTATNISSKYYQPSLLRLIEIAIVQRDFASVAPHLTALDRISAGLRQPSVPYVRGKLAYAQDKHDEAIAYFQEVPKGSDVELPATYYMATVYVAKKDIQRATEIFADLTGRKPRTANDRRIVELSQLALGRLFYERDQQSKAIDSYLLVDRRSDLFPDALYEVAWVYVKAKQYDKALRALELLSLSDPQSTKTPTVRILEGNLRIRKAQMVRGAQIAGTLDNRAQDNPATEYDKAAQVFSETHDMYVPSYAALSEMADGGTNPAQYLAQIAGRSEHVFQAAAPIPEAAIHYLREEPEVQRIVSVEIDLGDITSNMAETEATIARLEGVLAAGARTAVYPALATRRARIGAIQDDLIKLRNDLAEQQLRLVDGSAASLSAGRKQQFAAYVAMPTGGAAANERIAQAQERYDALEATVTEINDAIGATQAMSVALRKYSIDTPELPADQKRTLAGSLDDAAREAQSIEKELEQVERDLQIGRDLAGVGDESGPVRAARLQVKSAQDAEHRQLSGLAGSSRDRGKSQKLAASSDRAARSADQLQATEQEIDGLVEQGVKDIKVTLAQAKAELESYQAELDGYEAEGRSIGGEVLGRSFKGVKAKFYDIVIRSDVGNVDVAWSQKEDTDDDLKRLNLSRQRELKQLRDEFKDILDAGTQKPSAPAKKLETPPPVLNQPSGSPDKGVGDKRVTPGSDQPAAPSPPTVKPDDRANKPAGKADARKPAPKGGTR